MPAGNAKIANIATMSSRTNNFDSIRAFAALMVIYGHSFPLSGAASPGILANSVQTLGLKIFFGISGYLVGMSWLKDPNLPRYLVRRSLRIFPGLALVVVLSVIFLGPLFSTLGLPRYFASKETWGYLLNLFLYISYSLPGVFTTNTYPIAVNGSLWSLPAEFAMYLIAPMLLAARRLPIMALASLAFGAAGVYASTYTHHSQIVVYNLDIWAWLGVAPYFIVGSFLALRGKRPDLQRGMAALAVLLLVGLPAAAQEFGLIFVLPYLIIALALADKPVFSNGARWGDLSYGLYIFGFPVEQVVSHF